MTTALSLAADLCRRFEGLRLQPYHCPAGFPTVGYGTLLSRVKHAPLDCYPSVTRQEADALLLEELVEKQGAVKRLIFAPLSEGQEGALIDFAFNLGAGALAASTLRARINRGDPEAAREFGRWVRAGGRVLPGLVVRRAEEAQLFWGRAGPV